MVNTLLSLVLRVLLVFLVGGKQATLFGAPSSDEVPDPLTWAASLGDQVFDSSNAYLSTICIWPSNKKAEKKWASTSKLFRKKSYLKYFPKSGLDFQSRLMKLPPLDDANQTPPNSNESTPMNALLVESGKNITLTHWRQGRKNQLETWTTPKGVKNPEDLLKLLRSRLGYDAVVLDQKERLILVGFIMAPEEEGQGLLLKKSEDKLVLGDKKPVGRALLQILKIKEGYGVVEVLLAKQQLESVPVGSKILLGRSDQLKSFISAAP